MYGLNRSQSTRPVGRPHLLFKENSRLQGKFKETSRLQGKFYGRTCGFARSVKSVKSKALAFRNISVTVWRTKCMD